MLLKSKALTKIQDLIIQLASHGLKPSKIEEKQYNFEISVNNQNEKVKVLVYFGKKGVLTTLQGDITSETYRKIKQIVIGESLFDSLTNNITEPGEYVGTDESGKGDLFGPLVVSGVYVNDRTKELLREIGVKDSKLLSDEQIIIISKKIREVIPAVQRNVITINPEKYNQLYSSFKNLNKLLAWGHSKAIENIVTAIKVQTAVSDKFGDEGLIISELAKKKIDINLHQEHKAERFTAVAAASILAREKMLHWFKASSKELKITIPKGAGDVANITMNKISEIHGTQFLAKLVKLHFKNYVNYIKSKKG
jgi:ribonuclease HIII